MTQPLHFMPQPLHFRQKSAKIGQNLTLGTSPARSIARPIAGHWINCPPICPHCIARAHCRPPYCPPFCMRPPAGLPNRWPDYKIARSIARPQHCRPLLGDNGQKKAPKFGGDNARLYPVTLKNGHFFAWPIVAISSRAWLNLTCQ